MDEWWEGVRTREKRYKTEDVRYGEHQRQKGDKVERNNLCVYLTKNKKISFSMSIIFSFLFDTTKII